MTPEQIRSSIESIVSKNEVFTEVLSDGFIDDIEQSKINTALNEIKKEIGILVQHPEELKLFNEELKKQIQEKWVSQEQVRQLFKKEYTDLQDTVLDTKQEAVEATVAKIKEDIRDIKKQVRFTARWEGKDVRVVKRYIFEWLDLATKRVNKYRRYHKKFDESERVLKREHEAVMFAKIDTLLANSKDYISQWVTGDLDEARKFFPPNIFNDASFYIPDKWPSPKTREQQIATNYGDTSSEYRNTQICQDNRIILWKWDLKERFAQNGLLWAIDTWLDKAWASDNTRSRAYQVGNVVWWVAKLWFLAYNGWNFVKSSFGSLFGKAEERWKNLKDTAKYGALLAWGYVFGPSIDKLVKGWDTSVWAANLMGNMGAKVEWSLNWLSSKEKIEISTHTAVCEKLFWDYNWSQVQRFTNTKWEIDFNLYKSYIEQTEGINSEKYNLLIEQQHARPQLQKFLLWMGMGATYITTKSKLNPTEKFNKLFEENKREADEFVEDYILGTDKANIIPELDTIEAQMNSLQDPQLASFKKQKHDIERQVNILHRKHTQARPIKVYYNTSNSQLELESYNQKTQLTIDSSNPSIQSKFNNTERKTSTSNEAWRVAHLVNFLTDPKHKLVNGTKDQYPYNISFTGDIEFSKDDWRNSLKNLKSDWFMDVSVLEDSLFSPRFKELYPSIHSNKKEFAQWLNTFKKTDGTSLWLKTTTA